LACGWSEAHVFIGLGVSGRLEDEGRPIDIFFSSLIVLNAVCALLILLSGLQKQKVYFYALSMLCLLNLVFNWVTWRYHLTTDLNDALLLARWQASLIMVALPLMTYAFGHWSSYRHTNALVAVLCLFSVLGVALNLTLTYPVRFGSIEALISYVTVFGDTAHILKGRTGDYVALFHFLSACNGAVLILFASRFFQQRKSLISVTLFVTALLMLMSSLVGYKVDSGQWPLVYVGGLPVTVLALMATVLISSNLKQKTSALIVAERKNTKLEAVFSRLAQTVSNGNSSQFYLEMAASLYQCYQADLVVIGLSPSDNNAPVQLLAALEQGRAMGPFQYRLQGSASETLFSQNHLLVPEHLQQLFPADQLARQQDLNAYLGVVLRDVAQHATGFIALMFRQPVLAQESLTDVLDICASRISAEVQRDQLEQQLKSMAYFDYLSGLPNRAQLLEKLNHCYVQCQKLHCNALFMLIDLDHFGDINRKYGYEVGDQVLRQLSGRLAHYASKEVFVARNNGDAFVILLQQVSGDALATLNVHWTAIKAIISQTCLIGLRQINVGCSMGAVLFPAQINSRFDVISSAEHALQQAKQKGRDQFRIFDPDILANLDRKKQLEQDLKLALASADELFMVYQPKVDAQGQLLGAEALIRWTHPSQGAISPVQFIPLAEETGLIQQLGHWVIRHVCQDLRQWQQQGVPLVPVAINMTASEFEDNTFIDFLIQQVAAHQLAPTLLEIELTESGLLTGKQLAITNLNLLRAEGFRVALDDFGTGYSSLSYLQELPLDVLKIDKSFVDNLPQQRSVELIRSILSIAKNMGLDTVAEGTETQAQVDLLCELGCDCFQGYFFSKPLQKDDFVVFCQRYAGEK